MDNYENYFTEAVKRSYPNRSNFLLIEIRKNFGTLTIFVVT